MSTIDMSRIETSFRIQNSTENRNSFELHEVTKRSDLSQGVAGSHSKQLSWLCTCYFRMRAPRVSPTPLCFSAYLFLYSTSFSGAFATFASGSQELCSGP